MVCVNAAAHQKAWVSFQLPKCTVESKIALMTQEAKREAISLKKFNKMFLRKIYDDLKVAREIVIAILMRTLHPLIHAFLLA